MWGRAYRQLLSDADVAVSRQVLSVTFAGPTPESGDNHDYASDPACGDTDGVANPASDRSDYMMAIYLGAAVRRLGLAYGLTDQSRYAHAAVRLIKGWCLDPRTRMNPRFTCPSAAIELSITMPGMFYGADLIWDYPGWEGDQRSAFAQWVADLAADGRGWTRDNNIESWRLVLIATASALLDDQAGLDYAFDRWRELLDTQMREDGALVHELRRTNSLSYSVYGLNAMVQTAEVARHHGVDLYGYVSPGGRSLKQALDFYVPYVLDPAEWTCEQIHPYKGQSAAAYEVAYAALGEPAYLEVANHLGRPMVETRTMGPVTLTHGRDVDG